MRYSVLLLSLLAAPAQAQSGGFSAQDLAAAARAGVAATAPDATATRLAAARSEQLRAVLAVAIDRAPAALTPPELRLITTALGPPSEDRDILLAWLMRGGAVAVAGADLTGIYNPFADGWLVLGWDAVGGRPHLASASLITGEALREAMAAPLDRTDMPFAQALVARRLQSLAAFEQVDSDDFAAIYPALRISQSEAVIARARAQVGALAQWSRDNHVALTEVDRAISRATDPALLAFPDRVRDALSPVALVSTPDGPELVLQSPAYPARSLFARVPADGGQPHLFALNLDPATGSFAR